MRENSSHICLLGKKRSFARKIYPQNRFICFFLIYPCQQFIYTFILVRNPKRCVVFLVRLASYLVFWDSFHCCSSISSGCHPCPPWWGVCTSRRRSYMLWPLDQLPGCGGHGRIRTAADPFWSPTLSQSTMKRFRSLKFEWFIKTLQRN